MAMQAATCLQLFFFFSVSNKISENSPTAEIIYAEETFRIKLKSSHRHLHSKLAYLQSINAGHNQVPKQL